MRTVAARTIAAVAVTLIVGLISLPAFAQDAGAGVNPAGKAATTKTTTTAPLPASPKGYAAGTAGASRLVNDTAGVGIVSHIKVVSDKVQDVSSMEAWKGSFIKDGMKDADKAMACWKAVAMFGNEGAEVKEYMGGGEDCVHDVIKTFNVYGANFCDCSGGMVAELARYAGLQARGWTLHGHVLSEVFYDGGWHMLDAAYMNYFIKPDGQIASVEEIRAAVKEWYDANPGYLGDGNKLQKFQKDPGWKKGPALLATCPIIDEKGNFPGGFGYWQKTMVNYDGAQGTPKLYEPGYFEGYQVNVQLRKGERLIRNWSNKGKELPLPDGLPESFLTTKVGQGMLKDSPAYGDLSNQRVGHGVLEYSVPLADGSFRGGALVAENLATVGEDGQKGAGAVHVKDSAKPGVLVIRMASSYLYLTGKVAMEAVIGDGGAITTEFSDNNGLDWSPVAKIDKSGKTEIDLNEKITRRYDYQVRFTMTGAGTGLETLKITHDILQSQRALPALAKGDNAIEFSAAPAEGTITVSGNGDPASTKQIKLVDFHPELESVDAKSLNVKGKGTATFRVSAPGEIARVRMGGNYRARGDKDVWEYQVSFDDGKTFETIGQAAGPAVSAHKYVTFDKVPAGVKTALVRFSGKVGNTLMMFRTRIDVDYKEPAGGFRPIKVTYQWEEDGKAKEDVHTAKSASEKYTIKCEAKPVMKAIVLEWAE